MGWSSFVSKREENSYNCPWRSSYQQEAAEKFWLAKLTEFHHTVELEHFHSLILKYLPKREHFSFKGMVARTQLAALDHNFNINRKQSVVTMGAQQGEKRYNVVSQNNERTG